MDREFEAGLAAYRVIFPDGPAFSTLAGAEQMRWRNAAEAGRAANRLVVKLSPGASLCESSFNFARTLMGGTPADKVTIVGSSVYGAELLMLMEKYGCAVIEVPPDAFVTRWTWVAVSGDGIVWSNPVD